MPFANWLQKLASGITKFASNSEVIVQRNVPIVDSRGMAQENWVDVSTIPAISVFAITGDIFEGGYKISEIITHRCIIPNAIYLDPGFRLSFVDPYLGTARILRVVHSTLADGRANLTIAYCRETPV